METPQGLQSFEVQISKTILERGKAYYDIGNVIEVQLFTKDIYKAEIEGTERYEVSVEVVQGEILEYACNCPYNRGPICKHVVASLYHLREVEFSAEEEETVALPSKKVSSKNVKKKTIKEELEALLAEITTDELQAFVLEKALNDTSFRRLLKTSLIRAEHKQSKGFYRKQIKAILRTAKYQGFINRPAMRTVNQQILPFLNIAEEGVEKQDFSSSFLISAVVLEEMTAAFNFADDSNGDIGDLIHFARDILKRISQATLSKSIRKAFFNYCLKEFKKERFEGWDWHFDLLKFAAELFESTKEAEALMNLLDENAFQEYSLQAIQCIKYQLIQKVEGASMALLYLEQNIKNPDLRKIALQKAFDQRNYAQVIVLANDGIDCDQKYAGLVHQWKKWLLKVAQKQKDRATIIKYAQYFFIRGSEDEQDYYYQLLQQTVPSNDWAVFLENLITDLRGDGAWYNKVALEAGIYIQKKWWARLFKLVQSEVDFHVLERYGEYLKKDYRTDLIELYAQQILKYMNDNVGRKHYKKACRYIRSMQKLGDQGKVQELVQTLRLAYPKRSALLDELNDIS
jgi:hypothetical protein